MSLESFSTQQLLNLKHNIYHPTFIIRNSAKTVGQQRRVIQLQIYNNIINSHSLSLSLFRYIFIALHIHVIRITYPGPETCILNYRRDTFFLLSQLKTNNNGVYCTVGMENGKAKDEVPLKRHKN